jgi:hypothetical protein
MYLHSLQNRLEKMATVLFFCLFLNLVQIFYIYSNNVQILIFDFWCFNATFSNISAISWQPVLVVEDDGVPGENHRPWASNW